MKVAKDLPLAEITLRKYEKPYSTNRRDQIRKLCLSIGLLQPGDSRDIIVDVFQTIIEKKEIEAEQIPKEVIALRKQAKLPLLGIAPSNIRRQLKRLKDLYLIEKTQNIYRIAEKEELITIFEEKIEKFYLKSIVERVKEHFRALR